MVRTNTRVTVIFGNTVILEINTFFINYCMKEIRILVDNVIFLYYSITQGGNETIIFIRNKNDK